MNKITNLKRNKPNIPIKFTKNIQIQCTFFLNATWQSENMATHYKNDIATWQYGSAAVLRTSMWAYEPMGSWAQGDSKQQCIRKFSEGRY